MAGRFKNANYMYGKWWLEDLKMLILTELISAKKTFCDILQELMLADAYFLCSLKDLVCIK